MTSSFAAVPWRPRHCRCSVWYGTTGDVFVTWRAECAAADAVIAQVADLAAISKPSRNDPRPVSLRWILVHMIEEYARHLGHADLLRQSIDGAVGDFDEAQILRWE